MSTTARRLKYLEAMGIDVWVHRAGRDTDTSLTNEPSAELTVNHSPPAGIVEKEKNDEVTPPVDWDALRTHVSECTLCELHKTRTQTVFGTGNTQASWLFIGEAPGADEDRQGEPFVGRAGQLLTSMIRALGFTREQVYIANILKCRPPNNRDPSSEEVTACHPYLHRQIELLNPKIIVLLGRIAAQNLLQTDTPIGRLRGHAYVYEDTKIPMVVTYHPAYLLRSPREKRKVWDDLRIAMALIKNQRT